MGILNKETIEKMKKINWGCKHLIWKLYFVKKYSPATKGLKGKLWVIDFAISKKKQRRE